MVNTKTNMEYHVKSCPPIKGDITVPADKSISHRALILGALANGQTEIHNLLMGGDNLSTINVLKQLGVPITIDDNAVVHIQGVGLHGLKAPTQPLDFGNSGTALRLMAGVLAAQPFDSELIGDQSLNGRPMRRIAEPLKKMGAKIEITLEGTPPIKIQGQANLQGIRYELPMPSAQVKSCLLLAGLYAQGETTVVEDVLCRDHTERMLAQFGCAIDIDSDCSPRAITISGGQSLTATRIDIPADMSSAAFFILAATIVKDSQIMIRNVNINPTRSGLLELLAEMGANITLHNRRTLGAEPVADIEVKSSKLTGIKVPFCAISNTIDEFPALFVAAACAEGETHIRNAEELRLKETDRIMVMVEGLDRLGIDCRGYDDGAIIEGGSLQGGTVNSYGDHRTAMAFAIAGCVAKSPITIQRCKNVSTSFPGFVELANSVGMQIEQM